MFLDIDKKDKSHVAIIDSLGIQITYGGLTDFSEEYFSVIQKRTLIFILSENCIGSAAGYIASLSGRIVPLLLSSGIDRGLLANLIAIYRPEYLWIPSSLSENFHYRKIFEKFGYLLLKTGFDTPELYDDLSLLLTTSGSTGSPKLVRHSYSNVETNARNVAASAGYTAEDRGIASLPMNFTMGLFVVTSHLYKGAKVLLTHHALNDRNFWQFIKDNRATNFSGVPYNYEILYKLRFLSMNLPDLRLLIVGGGKLKADLFKEFAEFAQKTGRRFIAGYGQTEGTSRMAFLEPEMAVKKTGSIGKALFEGTFSLINEEGEEISESEAVGELVYRGPNVTLGYALTRDDLTRGDENKGVLHTGDIAKRDSDGYYFIVGRISRFLKLYGLRIGLDETEHLIRSEFDIECMCTGNDDKMTIKITDKAFKDQIHDFITKKTGLFHTAIEVIVIDKIPRNESGKIIY